LTEGQHEGSPDHGDGTDVIVTCLSPDILTVHVLPLTESQPVHDGL
jgi:hypothetical protein